MNETDLKQITFLKLLNLEAITPEKHSSKVIIIYLYFFKVDSYGIE